MTYADQLANPQFIDNVVIRIDGGPYIGKRLPDSGIAAQDFKAMILPAGGFTVNPQVLDLEDAKASFGTNTYRLVDLDQAMTKLLRLNTTAFINKKVETWLGFSGVGLDFANYKQLQDTVITSAKYRSEIWDLVSSDATATLAKVTVFNLSAKLLLDTVAGANSLKVQGSIAAFPPIGRIFVQNELLDYTAKDDATGIFTLAVPAVKDHSKGDDVKNVFRIDAENPIDILLRILQSTGGGSYADYPDGFGLEDTAVDVAAMEAIRDRFFTDEEFSFQVFGVENGLDWLADNILKPCSLRFITSINSKLSLTVLDQSLFGGATRTVDPSTTERDTLAWQTDDSLVRNKVTFKYGYDWENDVFTRTHEATDQNSIDEYGERDAFVVEAKGVLADDRGDLIAEDRVSRWLARLATATPKVTATALMVHALTLIGDRVLVMGDLPTRLGDRNFAEDLEVTKKSLVVESGRVDLEFSFTNYTGLRECFMSPSDLIVTVVSQRKIIVTAGRGSLYEVGYVMRLQDEASGEFTTDAVRTIIDITGDTITFDADFDVSLLGTGFRIQFADYDEVNAAQRRYGFMSAGAADFADGTPPYQITF